METSQSSPAAFNISPFEGRAFADASKGAAHPDKATGSKGTKTNTKNDMAEFMAQCRNTSQATGTPGGNCNIKSVESAVYNDARCQMVCQLAARGLAYPRESQTLSLNVNLDGTQWQLMRNLQRQGKAASCQRSGSYKCQKHTRWPCYRKCMQRGMP